MKFNLSILPHYCDFIVMSKKYNRFLMCYFLNFLTRGYKMIYQDIDFFYCKGLWDYELTGRDTV